MRQICKVRNAANSHAQASVTQSVVIRADYKQWNLLYIQPMTGKLWDLEGGVKVMIAGKWWTMQPLPHTVGGKTYKGGFDF